MDAVTASHLMNTMTGTQAPLLQLSVVEYGRAPITGSKIRVILGEASFVDPVQKKGVKKA
jgi:hypothetical protein